MPSTRTHFLLITLSAFLLGATACKGDAADATADSSAAAADSLGASSTDYPTAADPRSPDEIVAELNAGGRVGPLEAYPADKLSALRGRVTKIDLVFFTEGVSMSLDNPQAVAYALAAVSPTKATRRPNCQPIGRMFMSAGQESVAEADVFFSEGCTYFEVFEGKKPGYANEMTVEGKAFFNENLRKAIPGFEGVK